MKVFDFSCWLDDDAQRTAIQEIERGRQYYNSMIAELNRRVQEEIPIIEALSAGDRFLARLALLWPWWDPSRAQQEQCDTGDPKTKQAIAIYASIAHHARDVRRDMPASSSGCYTGTYHAVHAAFDAAVGDKRKGTWPGDPYKFRRASDRRGAACGVHLQGGSYTWGGLLSGKYSVAQVGELDSSAKQATSISCAENHHWEKRIVRLRVAKDSLPITIHVKLHRSIPHDAVVSHVMLVRGGDYGSRIRWRLLVTASVAAEEKPITAEPVGVAVGLRILPDGGLHLATASSGEELVIPAYAVRMNQKLDVVNAARESAALLERDKLEGDKSKLPSAPASVARYIDQNGIHGHGEFLSNEHELHCLDAHLRRRSEAIRKEATRQFVAALRGKLVYIEHRDQKTVLTNETENSLLKFASVGRVSAALLAAGAIEVEPVERLGDVANPTADLANKIITAGLHGKLFARAARKPIRKYRKSKKAA